MRATGWQGKLLVPTETHWSRGAHWPQSRWPPALFGHSTLSMFAEQPLGESQHANAQLQRTTRLRSSWLPVPPELLLRHQRRRGSQRCASGLLHGQLLLRLLLHLSQGIRVGIPHSATMEVMIRGLAIVLF